MHKLLILSDNAPEYARHLAEFELPGLEIYVARDEQQAIPLLDQADIILGKPALTAPLLDRATKLEWLQSTFAGVEPLCASGLRADYTLTGVKDVFGPLMSEYVFAYILALERHLFTTRDNQFSQHWRAIPYRGLSEITIGICGLGSIGRAIVGTAAHFQMHVLGLSRSGSAVPAVERVFAVGDIAELAGQVDYLVVVLPDTRETRGLIDRAVLQALRPSSVLINVGRGSSVDEQALIDALRQGRLRAAVLDVFQQEPLPGDSPLWALDNVYITPHNAAVSFARDIVRIFERNYRRFVSAEPLQYVIDFERGY